MVKKKTNPLNKRFLRELKSEAGKYIVLFVFIAGVIALVSGFLVASGSMSQAYDESFEKYNIEDGNFEVKREASSGLLDALQKDGTKIYPNFYKEEQTKNVESTLYLKVIWQHCTMQAIAFRLMSRSGTPMHLSRQQ